MELNWNAADKNTFGILVLVWVELELDYWNYNDIMKSMTKWILTPMSVFTIYLAELTKVSLQSKTVQNPEVCSYSCHSRCILKQVVKNHEQNVRKITNPSWKAHIAAAITWWSLETTSKPAIWKWRGLFGLFCAISVSRCNGLWPLRTL